MRNSKALAPILIPGLTAFLGAWDVGATAASPTEWGLNDVSVLLPIKQPDLLPTPAFDSKYGPLLPQSILEKIGKLNSFEDAAITHRKLRVVGIRFDPCFPSGKTFRECRSQIRLVWQPIETTTHDRTGYSVDAALHSFYDIPHGEFDSMMRDYEKIRAELGGDLSRKPLTVHPIIVREGLNGPYFRALKKLLHSQTGAGGLTRVTFMKLVGGGTVWDFGGFEVLEGRLVPLTVARTGERRQMFVNAADSRSSDFVSTSLHKKPASDLPNVNWLIQDSNLVRTDPDGALILSNFIDARWIENPRKVVADRMDCVSCHVAQAAKLWALDQFPDMNLDAQSDPVAYRSRTQPLKNVSRAAHLSTNLRSFGYFGREPAISARVINESAEVADALNQTRSK